MSGRKFVVPVDDTEGASKAVDWTLANLVKPEDELHLVHVIPVPMPEVVGGVGVGGAGDFLIAPPDPRVDRANIDRAEKFIASRLLPSLTAAKVPYKVEILHFGTDADSVGQVVAARAKALGAAGVVLTKHNKGAVKEFILGSTAKFLTKNCEVPVVVLHA